MLPLLLFGLVQLKAQDTILVTGNIANSGGNSISVDISVMVGRTPMTSTVKTDLRGTFSETFVSRTTVMQATVTASITDCQRKTVTETSAVRAGSLVAMLRLDYCSSGSGSKGCEAIFKASQAYNGRTPIPGQIVIREASKGTNITYSWNFGDGSTSRLKNPKHSYSGNGPYLLCLAIADTNGCQDTLCDSITVDTTGMLNLKKEGFSISIVSDDGPVSIETVEFNTLDAGVYPNPVSGDAIVHLHLKNASQVRMRVYDISGQVILDRSSVGLEGDNNLVLDMNGLQPGAYMVKLNTNESQWTESVIKK